MSYRFKLGQEALWFVAVAVVTVLAQELLTFDATAVTDWRVWAVALASAIVRAAAGALLAWIGRHATVDPHRELVERIEALTPEERDRLADDLIRRNTLPAPPPPPPWTDPHRDLGRA